MANNIVFINQATGYLTIDIINEFARDYDHVGLIYGEIRVQDIELDNNVIKTKIVKKKRGSNFSRFSRWFIATVQIYFLLITKYRKFEIFYFTVPPFAYLLSLLLRRRFSLLMWDVYPYALKITGIKESNIIFRMWGKANQRIFRSAYRIFTIGNGLAKLISDYVSPERIEVIPIWSGITDYKPVSKKKNPFIINNNLDNKFIVQYSGNIGAGHNIESLLEAAKKTISDQDIIYLIIGRGLKLEKVKTLIEKNNLRNCMVLPFQPDDQIKYSISAADLSVVLIEDELAQVSIPSKVYNIMKVGSVILSISPDNSELGKTVMKYRNGRNFDKSDINNLVEFIIDMKQNPDKLLEYKKRSLAAANDFSIANAKKFLDSYLNQ